MGSWTEGGATHIKVRRGGSGCRSKAWVNKGGGEFRLGWKAAVDGLECRGSERDLKVEGEASGRRKHQVEGSHWRQLYSIDEQIED